MSEDYIRNRIYNNHFVSNQNLLVKIQISLLRAKMQRDRAILVNNTRLYIPYVIPDYTGSQFVDFADPRLRRFRVDHLPTCSLFTFKLQIKREFQGYLSDPSSLCHYTRHYSFNISFGFFQGNQGTEWPLFIICLKTCISLSGMLRPHSYPK